MEKASGRCSGPNRSAISEADGGVLARSDAGADVADAIYELWKEPERAAELGRRGADGVRRHYSVTHMAEKVLSVYQEAIGARG